VLLDIEGTTTPIDFVHKTLFGYARARVTEFLGRHWTNSDVRADIARLSLEHLAEPSQPPPPPWHDEIPAVAAYVQWLIDQDRKSTGLKSLQGKIWETGYRSGELRSEVYPDVPLALERWQSAGIRVAIFSSGSIQAQQSLFRSTQTGDLTRYFTAYFDTTTGAKTAARSYTLIAESLKCPPSGILFVSDVAAELDAARAAGLQTVLCARPPASLPSDGVHPTIQSFEQLNGRITPAPSRQFPAAPALALETNKAVTAWMARHGWPVTTRWQQEPEMGFHVWEEETPSVGRAHALWLAEPMVQRLGAEELVRVLNQERVAEEIRISFRVRIEERGAEFRVSVVPRSSGEFRRQD
jgi:enolase-phosphatase E1